MSSIDRSAGSRTVSLVLLGVIVGLGTYAGRVWWHHTPPALRASSFPPPEHPSKSGIATKQFPQTVDGYELVSVVPEVKGHDLHALYESEHHVSLFIRPVPAHPGPVTVKDVGKYWLPADPLIGNPAFVRTDVNGRSALAWIARGKRHIVTGDVPLDQLRIFANSYEQALSR